MLPFFAQFHVVGEVAETKLVDRPDTRLLIDISMQPALKRAPEPLRYPQRISFSTCNPVLIRRFQAEVNVGDTVDLRGCFQQGHYVAMNSGYVDTTFEMDTFQCLGRGTGETLQETKVNHAATRPVLH